MSLAVVAANVTIALKLILSLLPLSYSLSTYLPIHIYLLLTLLQSLFLPFPNLT